MSDIKLLMCAFMWLCAWLWSLGRVIWAHHSEAIMSENEFLPNPLLKLELTALS